jgi:predicted GTPase
MKLYTVIGNNRGKRELVLSTSKERAKEITTIREMGGCKVEIYDKKPINKITLKNEYYIYHCDETNRDFTLALDIIVDDAFEQFAGE